MVIFCRCYSIGRHSKSLNLDRKCCGYCRGRFEVFLTSQLSNTNTKCNTESTKKQRAPNAFAVFVKENYATVKQENKVAHGEIMKLLSQKFAQIKVWSHDDEPTLMIYLSWKRNN